VLLGLIAWKWNQISVEQQALALKSAA
jgi:hypothetical protein